jgi:hypothetical protein
LPVNVVAVTTAEGLGVGTTEVAPLAEGAGGWAVVVRLTDGVALALVA